MKPESVVLGGRYSVPTFIHLKQPAVIVTVRSRCAPNWFKVEYPNGDIVTVHYSDLNETPAPCSVLDAGPL